jgi:hypothetical protein
MRLSQSHDPTYRYMIFNLDLYRFFCLFFTPIYFFNFMDLLKIKLLYFFCFAFYDNNFASRSKSHVCHASLDWLEAFTLFYFIFMSNLFLIVLIFYPFLKLIFFFNFQPSTFDCLWLGFIIFFDAVILVSWLGSQVWDVGSGWYQFSILIFFHTYFIRDFILQCWVY